LSIIEDPLFTLISSGTNLEQENLLRYFFLGFSSFIGFALLSDEDPFVFKFLISTLTFLTIILYFFLGRREITAMCICFYFLLRKGELGMFLKILLSVLVLGSIITVLALRSSDYNDNFVFSTASEELSTLGFSSYVIANEDIEFIQSFTKVTFLRPYLYSDGISAEFIRKETNYIGSGSPVIGIAGITFMYGFIIPIITLIILGSLFKTISIEYSKKKTSALKLLLIFVTFKTFNLFRNGEFPIVILDVVKFLILCSPAIFLKFKNTNA
jgi:hypothetical protein